jgi:ribonucleoside-diphosphate reductase alpha chain
MPDALAKILAEHFEFKVNGRVVDAKPKNGEMGTNGNTSASSVSSNGNGATNGNGHGLTLNGHAPVAADAPPTQTTMMQQLAIPQESSKQIFDLCPECGGASLAREEGCKKCYACGYAEC